MALQSSPAIDASLCAFSPPRHNTWQHSTSRYERFVYCAEFRNKLSSNSMFMPCHKSVKVQAERNTKQGIACAASVRSEANITADDSDKWARDDTNRMTNMRQLTPILYLLFSAATLSPAITGAQQLPLRYYGQQDGLANLATTALARDRSGYLWVGTENGLFRYNGASFQRYAQGQGLKEPLVTGLMVDHDDQLWVGSYNGLYLKMGERLQPVPSTDGKKVDIWPAQNLSSGPDGSRYVVSAQHAYSLTVHNNLPALTPVFTEQEVKQYPSLAHVASVYADRDSTLWMGCGSALCHRNAKGLMIWGSAQGVPSDIWRAILRDRSGQLWAHGEHHIIALPPSAKNFIDRTPPGNVLRKVSLQATLAEDADGRILINVDSGIFQWDRSRWIQYGATNGLRSGGGLNALLFDPDGDLWIGSHGLGLISWRGYSNWENWTLAQGLPDDVVLSFVRDKKNVLHIGTRSGPASLLPNTGNFVPATAGQMNEWSSMVVDGSGQIWGSSYAGDLMRISSDGQIHVHAKHLSQINRLLVDQQQRLWLSTEEGIVVVDTTVPDQPVRKPDGLPPQSDLKNNFYAEACQAPNGDIWFLAADHLLQLHGTQWHRHSARQFGERADLYSMSCSANSTLWLADTRGNLWHGSPNSKGFHVARIDNQALDGASIIALHEDRRGWLWIGTDAGVAVWNRDHWRFLNQTDGLVWNDTNGTVFYEDVDGSMWIATSNGASHIRRPTMLFAPQNLTARIEAARRGTQPLALNQPWTLPWSTAPLEVNLASLHYRNRSSLRFHYRMAGLELNWAESAIPQLRYAALPPGDYEFEYYASNAYSGTSPVQRQMITVLPPWWRTTPFYLLCLLVLLLLLTMLYRFRVRQLLQRQLHTEQLVRERTQELEASREQLRQRALRDSLTGAWNRGAIMEIIEHGLEQALARKKPLLLVMLDLDHFKRINDTYGHTAGDTVLREAVARLSAAVRQNDAVGRYGGEEFLVVLPDLDEVTGRMRVEQLREVIRREPVQISSEQAITVTGSFGAIAFEPGRPRSTAELIAHADQALYRSKENGRDRIEYAGPYTNQATLED